jgi:hypothetical protein
MRYSIFGKQYGSDRESELAQCDSNPQAVLDGLKAKTLTIRHGIFENTRKKQTKVSKYTWLRIVDHGER